MVYFDINLFLSLWDLTHIFNYLQVGDFATVRAAPTGISQTVQNTHIVIGTPVYLAPEAIAFDVSTKLDSYSFGIVLLEILTGIAIVRYCTIQYC